VAARIANKAEMFTHSGVVQHGPSIATDWEHSARFDDVVVVEHEVEGMVFDAALIDNRLAVIFTVAF
jgi:hypothetical protein